MKTHRSRFGEPLRIKESYVLRDGKLEKTYDAREEEQQLEAKRKAAKKGKGKQPSGSLPYQPTIPPTLRDD